MPAISSRTKRSKPCSSSRAPSSLPRWWPARALRPRSAARSTSAPTIRSSNGKSARMRSASWRRSCAKLSAARSRRWKPAAPTASRMASATSSRSRRSWAAGSAPATLTPTAGPDGADAPHRARRGGRTRQARPAAGRPARSPGGAAAGGAGRRRLSRRADQGGLRPRGGPLPDRTHAGLVLRRGAAMGLLSDSDVASMRKTAEEALPSTGKILRLTQTSDGQGGLIDKWVTRVKEVACRLDPQRIAGEAEKRRGGRAAATSDFLITFPAETVVQPADRVEIAGRTFEVDRPRDRDKWEITLRVEASEVGVGGQAPEA